MTVRDDLRALAEIDTHHGSLRDLSDDIMERQKLTILVERTDAGDPLVVAAVKEAVCPIDRSATFKVEYWLADIRRDVQDAMLKSAIKVGEELARRGHTT